MKGIAQESIGAVAIALCLLVPAAGRPQDVAKASSAKPAAREPAAPKSEKKPALAEITRVSTAEAARSAAKEQAKQCAGEGSPEESAEPAVTELQPVAQDADASSGAVVAPTHESKKSVLKNIHGTVYGSRGARHKGDQRAGAAVGASSKGGKTSIYVETERSRETVPPPR